MKTKISFVVLLLVLSFGCASKPTPVDRTYGDNYKPMSLNAANEVFRVCSQTKGVSCSLNDTHDRLSILIDKTGTVSETKRGVLFMSTYYCRLTRLEGNDNTRVLLIRPDGSQSGRPCNLVGTTK
jgi:hypothetical protein